MSVGTIVLAAGILVQSSAAKSALPEPATAARIQQGAELFETNCSLCHGQNMDAQPGMKDLRAFSGDKGVFRTTVATGNSIMPGFDGVFSPEELDALYAYVKSGGEAEARDK